MNPGRCNMAELDTVASTEYETISGAERGLISDAEAATEVSRRSRDPWHKGGLVRLLGVSGVTMSIALSIGVLPRVVQGLELERAHEKLLSEAPVVATARAKAAPGTRQLDLPGAIEAILETPVYTRANGYIKQRFVDIGDSVRTGQLLVNIETPEVEDSEKEAQALVLTSVANEAESQANRDRARADLAKAKADLSQSKATLLERKNDEKFAHTTHLRWKELSAQGAISQQDADEKETRSKTSEAATQAALDQVRAAEAEVMVAEARVKAEEANIQVSRANISAARAREKRSTTEKSFQRVYSPFAGVITERNIDSGTLVSAGSDSSRVPLYRIARIDTVKVFIDVPQYAAPGVRVGQRALVTLKEYPGRAFEGKVVRTSVALDPTARTLRTELHISNRDQALRPGMYADVSFAVPRTAPMALIPANSLITRAAGPQVVTVSDQHVHYRNVRLGEDLGKEIEVTKGLSEIDLIVVNPSDALVDGSRVTVAENNH